MAISEYQLDIKLLEKSISRNQQAFIDYLKIYSTLSDGDPMKDVVLQHQEMIKKEMKGDKVNLKRIRDEMSAYRLECAERKKVMLKQHRDCRPHKKQTLRRNMKIMNE